MDKCWSGQFIKAGPTTFLLINLIAQNRKIFNQLDIHKRIFDDIDGTEERKIINPTTTTTEQRKYFPPAYIT